MAFLTLLLVYSYLFSFVWRPCLIHTSSAFLSFDRRPPPPPPPRQNVTAAGSHNGWHLYECKKKLQKTCANAVCHWKELSVPNSLWNKHFDEQPRTAGHPSEYRLGVKLLGFCDHLEVDTYDTLNAVCRKINYSYYQFIIINCTFGILLKLNGESTRLV